MRQGKAAHTDVLFVLAGVLAAAATILGGASRDNALRLAIVELCALPLSAVAIRRMTHGGYRRQDTTVTAAFIVLGLVIAVPLLQLIPLPPHWWTSLPGQAPRMEALSLAHLAPPWLPMSLAPAETAGMALALIPPVAIFLATLSLSTDQTRRLTWLWIALASAGLLLGVVQIAAPAGSPAYPYRTTNLGSLVGLFANRNHEAGFLLALAPFAAALASPAARRRGIGPGRVAPGLFIVFSVVALGVIHSRSGVLLAGPAVVLSLAVLWRGDGGRRGWRPAAAVGGAVILAVGAVAAFGLTPILARFGPQTAGELRFEAWPYVAAAAQSFQPLGSGLGSFDRVFQAVEPLNLVAVTYFNHAHNDYLELWLETGWIGVAILCGFIFWLAGSSYRAWRWGDGPARAASAAILLMMAESVVDYPLRTETLMVLFAFCCGLLATGAGGGGGARRT